MRIGRAVLLIALAAVFAVAPGTASGSSGLPGAAYPWVQPDAAVAHAPFVQPPAWISIVQTVVNTPLPGSSYVWAQPGAAVVSVPSAQPPASIPGTSAVVNAPLRGSSYVWAQPGAAVVNVPSAQPPVWIPIIPSVS
ncbi:MAG TPA: hypothetical protein VF327_00390 [Gaiellaceae bacterium]